MAKGAIQIQLDFILNLLRKGGKRNDVLSKFGKKWQNVSTRTFDRRLKEAESMLLEENKRIKDKTEQHIAEVVEARKSEIMDALERKIILTQIARGEIPLKKPMIVDKDIREIDVVPDWMDRKNAINELNRMDGSHAPDKVAKTNTKGEDVEDKPNVVVVDASMLTDEQLDKILEANKGKE